MKWKVVNSSNPSSFEISYGEFKARIDLEIQPSWYETYRSRCYVYEIGAPYADGPMYEYSHEITLDRIYKLVQRGDKITDSSILKILEPVVDFAQFALFCCVAEKLICD